MPRLAAPESDAEVETAEEPNRPRTGESVRVPVRRVHGLLDVVGEAELETRRVERFVQELGELSTEQVRLSRVLRGAQAGEVVLPAEVSENSPCAHCSRRSVSGFGAGATRLPGGCAEPTRARS